MISLKICCLILCVHYVLLFSICYLSDWSYCLVNIQGWCHSILVIPFDFLSGMVPFHLVIYFWAYHLIFLQGWCHFIWSFIFGHTIWFFYRDGAISFWMIILWSKYNYDLIWAHFSLSLFIFGLPNCFFRNGAIFNLSL